MQKDELINAVRDRAGLPSRDEAKSAIEATLRVLVGHMAGGAPNNLAAQLPAGVREFLDTGTPQQGPDANTTQGERFGPDEFFRRVGERLQTGKDEGKRLALAVVGVLGQAVSAGELRKARLQFPEDWSEVFEAAGAAHRGEPEPA